MTRKKLNSSIARRMATQQWGEVQRQQKIAEGIWWFMTAGHGGLIVDTLIRPKLVKFEEIVYINAKSNQYYPCEQHFAAFEEDCMAAIPEYLYADEIITPIYMKGFCVPEDVSFETWKTKRIEMLEGCLLFWNREWFCENKRDEMKG